MKRYYYQFVVPNLSFIELDRRLPIEAMLQSQFPKYVGMQWERICRDAVTGNMVDGVVYGKADRWWGTVLNEERHPEQIEIDVVSESLDKKYLLVGECKWTAPEPAQPLMARLVRKARLLPFAAGRIVVPVLFLKSKPVDFEKMDLSDDKGILMLPEDVLRLSM